MTMPGSQRVRLFTYRSRHRVSLKRDFNAIFGARIRSTRGPLTVFTRANGLDYPRLGLAVGRRVGNAVKRNAVKRRIREAFRLMQFELPPGFDFVVSAAPHSPLAPGEYQTHLTAACRAAAKQWARRATEAPPPPPPPPPPAPLPPEEP